MTIVAKTTSFVCNITSSNTYHLPSYYLHYYYLHPSSSYGSHLRIVPERKLRGVLRQWNVFHRSLLYAVPLWYEDPADPSEVPLMQHTHDPYRVLNYKIQGGLLEVLVRQNYYSQSWNRPTAEPRHVWRVRQNPSLLLEGKFCEDCWVLLYKPTLQRTLSGGSSTGCTSGSLRVLPRRRRLAELAL